MHRWDSRIVHTRQPCCPRILTKCRRRIFGGLISLLSLPFIMPALLFGASDVTTPGDLIVGTSSNTPGAEGAANAIDNQLTKYLNFDRVNTGFTVTPGAGATVVSGLALVSANDAPDRD